MKKPWSITTTTRSPYRLRGQLRVLRDGGFVGREWTVDSQREFQISLIQHRLYGHSESNGFSSQFLSDLPKEYKHIFTDFGHDLTFEEAEAIFEKKNYTDPSMRGRQTFNPFKKFGFVFLDNGVLQMTRFGEHFLADDYDLPEIFFRIFTKWQLPNCETNNYKLKDGYNIKPFIATLHLINNVNSKWADCGNNPVGISKKEFGLFVPTLINYSAIDIQAQKIIALRLQQQGKNAQEKVDIFESFADNFAAEFLGSSNVNKIKKLLSNLKDYGDNAIRYFRFTRYIHIRGNGFYIDLENRRSVEIESLLAHDNSQSSRFASKTAYLSYIADISQPQFPWETSSQYVKIIQKLGIEIQTHEAELQNENIQIQDCQHMTNAELRKYIGTLRLYRRELQDEVNNKKAQSAEQLQSYIQNLKNIGALDNRPIMLEKFSALGLCALNDALKIRPNYPVGDDNEPTFTAPANTPDIECFYESFNAICEVTMLRNRDQWYNEGQPVMRHFRDFETTHQDKPAYCLFIAPALHRDTINTFWIAIRYGYEGDRQKIIPLSIDDFIFILEALLQMKTEMKLLEHVEISRLYDEILDSADSFDNSNKWLENIQNIISSWKQTLFIKNNI